MTLLALRLNLPIINYPSNEVVMFIGELLSSGYICSLVYHPLVGKANNPARFPDLDTQRVDP